MLYRVSIKLMSRTHPIESPRYDFACLCIYFACLSHQPSHPHIIIVLLCANFFCFYFSIWKHSRAILVRNTPVEALLNWKTRVQKTSTIILMMITVSGFDSCRNPFMWNELICSDDEGVHAVRSGFFRHHRLLQLGVAAGRQQICKTVKVSEGCSIFPGKKKKKGRMHNKKIVSRGGSHKSKRLDLFLSINNLLLWQPDRTLTLSQRSSDRRWKMCSFSKFSLVSSSLPALPRALTAPQLHWKP